MIYARSVGPLRAEVEKILGRRQPAEQVAVSPY
jgi:hypothetical protein